MTPRERATKLVQELQSYTCTTGITIPDYIGLCERAIIAAILEEREACAKIAAECVFTQFIETSADLREAITEAIRARK